MRFKYEISLLVLMLSATPVWAINKCIGADGRVVYTDDACPKKSKALSIEEPEPVSEQDRAAANARAKKMQEQARLLENKKEAAQAAQEREEQARKIRELEQALKEREKPTAEPARPPTFGTQPESIQYPVIEPRAPSRTPHAKPAEPWPMPPKPVVQPPRKRPSWEGKVVEEQSAPVGNQIKKMAPISK